MSYEKDITMRMEDVVTEGKQLIAEIAGHEEAAEVYRKHGMDGAAMLVEQKITKLKGDSDWLRKEWKRLKNELAELPY